jgi:deoxyribodipyrimidine photolyase-related protein
MPRPRDRARHLLLVLGDQLDHHAAVFEGIDPAADMVWMAEVDQEATHVWCHQQRIALFFSAMRHFRDELCARGLQVRYHALTTDRRRDRGPDFATILDRDVPALRPERLIVVWPGDYRVLSRLQQRAADLDVPLEVRPDRHFYCGVEEFRDFAAGRRSLLLETFYRHMRRKHEVLMRDGEPVGGAWNLDHDNRRPLPRSGPPERWRPRACRPDAVTREVLALVARRYANHPGTLDDFSVPVTRAQARRMLRDFIARGLPLFGTYEDAMWTDEPFLYHSRLSSSLNLKLLTPRECVDQAVAAYLGGRVPLNSAEGFVRQVLGWREFIRGVYWLQMPHYQELNALGHDREVPAFYWHGGTDLACVRQSLRHVLRYGYAHHIHRLMVLGNLA